MGPLQQVLLLALCLLVSLPLWGIVVRHRRKISGPSRVKAPDHNTSESSGVKAPVHEVNDSLDQLGKQSDVPTIQILFFHGLPLEDFSNVHLATWDNVDGIIWPQAWLVEEFPGAQIFFVKYGAALGNSKVFNMNNIGENLISDLLQANIGQVPDCPVVLVGHCIGGLVIKELCWKAHEELHSVEPSRIDRGKMLATFLDNIRGIYYYSTPHAGIREIAKASHLLRSPLFKFFETLSTHAAVLNSNFEKLRRRYPKWKIEGVGESLDVQMGVFHNTLVVEEASSRVGVDVYNILREDHFSISKPKERTSGGYYHFTSLLCNIVKERSQDKMMLQEQSNPRNMQHVSRGLVGMEARLREIRLRLESVASLGLTGMGGLGKTTLAKTLFNELGKDFEYSCFVPNVKLILGSVETLKKEVWKFMCRRGKEVGTEEQWSQLGGKHVLLVLDDVSTERDIKPFLEIAESFSMQSRLIATSREKDVFSPFADVYEVPFLDGRSAQHLFAKYAFQEKEIPPPKLASLMTQIVEKCEGLPLTLEVLGQYLKRKRNEEDWKQTLAALDEAKYVPNFNERLWMKLRPSIEGLEENEKQMFLEATAFFAHRWTLRAALAAWREAYGVPERLLWQTLVDRSLVIDVKEDESIEVHEQLRSLGRKIAKKCIGIIHIRKLEDIKLLQCTELDKKNIRALRITLGPRHGEENLWWESSADDGDSEQISFENGKVRIASLALQELKELRYLDIYTSDEIEGAVELISIPNRLVLLRCFGIKTLNLAHQSCLAVLQIGLRSLPTPIGQLSALRYFTFNHSSLESIPEEIAHLSKLEVLNVCCPWIQTLPEKFGELSKLKMLVLFLCNRLQSLPESFWKLSALNYLAIETCHGLVSLPESFGLLAELVDLKLKSCRELGSLPKTFGHLSALRRLEFNKCNRLRSLPDSFGKLSALNYLRFTDCYDLESLPESFGLLGTLADLIIEGCSKLESLPKTFGHLSALSRLELNACYRLRSLPESLGNLPALRHLVVSNCKVLHPLPESLGRLAKLEYFEIDYIKELETLPDSLAELGRLRHLAISKLSSLKSIPDYIETLPSLHTLELGLLPQVRELPPYLGETGVNYLGMSRKVFRKQDRHFFLTRDEVDFDSLKFGYWPIDLVGIIHSRAMQKVKTSDFEGALAELEVVTLGRPELEGFQLQEKGIIKRMMGDLHGALEDLTRALACFSKGSPGVSHGNQYSYDSWKHRGYVKFLMGDIEGAKNDGTIALRLQLDYSGSVLSKYRHVDSLGDECVEYMHFRLKTLQTMQQHERLLDSTVDEVLQKVKAADFEGALASFDVINVLSLRNDSRAYFLQERGVLKRLAGDLGGSLEDLTAALEIWGHDYDCWKHRGYVKYLLGDVDGAKLDAERCLQEGLPDYYPGAQHLAAASVAFMEYNLE